ncbi:MAG TPA: hypothetical protein VK517_12920 [Cyclobacteriaceae bacterium]|nr:hypothetical protein [Cyclobacteriaceae bacterium]
MKSLVLLLLCTTAAHAQYTLVPSSQYSRSLPVSQAKAVSMFDLFNNPLDEAHEYKGSPYLTKEFVKGVVETDKGKFSGLNMRYDIYSDIIEIRGDDSVFMMPPDTGIQKIEIGKTILVPRLAMAKGKSVGGYFTSLESGRLSVLKKMTVIYTPWKENPIDPVGTPPRFERGKDIYFFAVGDEYPVLVRNMKGIIAILPDHQAEMEKFSHADDTSPKKPESLKRFAQQYNRLVK